MTAAARSVPLASYMSFHALSLHIQLPFVQCALGYFCLVSFTNPLWRMFFVSARTLLLLSFLKSIAAAFSVPG